MYTATKTVIGQFPLTRAKPTDGLDKASIATLRTSPNQTREKVDIVKGQVYTQGDIVPCIFEDLVERGVLVESIEESTETVADVSGDKALESGTEFSVGSPE